MQKNEFENYIIIKDKSLDKSFENLTVFTRRAAKLRMALSPVYSTFRSTNIMTAILCSTENCTCKTMIRSYYW